ncbi:MAG: hypothetical protein OEM81_02660 [Acidimicrobiia bacterium]|nr:hypothetical protein [Acidimicrobiia bacterium]MDH3396716.1 hypothetical protein [Acidimicrobiia bacterium]MDH5615897.1 hypothetical protein [Acidimicrobiia bacterium]
MTNSSRAGQGRRVPLIAALLGTAAGLLIIISLLSSIEWDASALLRVGEDNPDIISYVEERLDHVRPVAPLGHDGKYYFIQAHDPLLLEPAGNADLIDRPVYWTQRMLYPLLSSAGGLLTGWAVVWGLIFVNLFAIALGTWATSRLAVSLGASPWLGLAFALNPGVIFELIIDGTGALGWALAVLGIWLLIEGKYSGAVVAIVGAVLAREAMILVGLGLAVRLWKDNRMRAFGMVAWPALAAIGWALWVRLQLGVPLLTSQSEEIGLPFVGLSRAISPWIEEPGRNLLFGAVVIVLLLVVVMQAVRRPSAVSYSTLGFVLMAPLLTRQVWLNYFDITRAIAPVFTTFVLVLFTRDSAELGANSHGK